MIVIQILIVIAGIYLYVLMGSFTVGLSDMKLYEVIVFLLWPAFLIGYVLYTTCESIGRYVFKPIDFMERLGRKINTYFESKNEKKGE